MGTESKRTLKQQRLIRDIKIRRKSKNFNIYHPRVRHSAIGKLQDLYFQKYPAAKARTKVIKIRVKDISSEKFIKTATVPSSQAAKTNLLSGIFQKNYLSHINLQKLSILARLVSMALNRIKLRNISFIPKKYTISHGLKPDSKKTASLLIKGGVSVALLATGLSLYFLTSTPQLESNRSGVSSGPGPSYYPKPSEIYKYKTPATVSSSSSLFTPKNTSSNDTSTVTSLNSAQSTTPSVSAPHTTTTPPISNPVSPSSKSVSKNSSQSAPAPANKTSTQAGSSTTQSSSTSSTTLSSAGTTGSNNPPVVNNPPFSSSYPTAPTTKGSYASGGSLGTQPITSMAN